MRKFSSRLVEDLFTDAATEGYVEMVSGLLDLLTSGLDLTDDDYWYIIGRLSFCYEYSEYVVQIPNKREDKEAFIPLYIRDQYKELWDQVITVTDTLDEVWYGLLASSDRRGNYKYFGNRDDIRAVSELTK